VALPFGRWVSIDRLTTESIIAYVYLDPQAGPSAKGALASEPDPATRTSHTVRLSDVTTRHMRELSDEEVRARKLPAQPPWLVHFGPQPDPSAPWRLDPLLAPGFHPNYPDDTQVLVHDGEPRRTKRQAEVCWVRLRGAVPAPMRTLLAIDDRPTAIQPSPHVYIGELLNQPHALTTVKRGDPIKLISVPGLPHPLHVTDDYLAERASWAISPCNRCGITEVFDPPSVMAKVRFEDARAGGVVQTFTAFCAVCSGVQLLKRLPEA
jgi:hypothetical protein